MPADTRPIAGSTASADANRRWVLAYRPEKVVREDCFRLETAPVPACAEGQFVVRVVYLSLAPVMAQYVIDGGVIADPVAIGDVMRGRGVGYVVASRHPQWREGDIVHGSFGWQDYAVSDGSGMTFRYQAKAPMSYALGLLGLTGFTAYFGLTEAGGLTRGDRVLVSGAAGGVGSVVGQLAMALGASQAVGLCGSDEKVAVATSQLGYTDAINYRRDDLRAAIAERFPEGIDLYFDNVGGEILEIAIDQIAERGRIALCGAISQYEQGADKRGPRNYFDLVYRNARMQGFHIYSYRHLYAEAEAVMAALWADGKLSALEDRLEGLQTMPAALRRLFEGRNTGKQIVQIAEDPYSDGSRPLASA